MGIYAVLATLTEAGARDIESIARRRADHIRELEHDGIKVLADYALMGGDYDFLYLVEAADDGTIMRRVVHDTKAGHLKFRTMPAMPLEKFAEIMREKEESMAVGGES